VPDAVLVAIDAEVSAVDEELGEPTNDEAW
jgi:hypothetical protein